MNELARTTSYARPTNSGMLPLREAFDRLFESALRVCQESTSRFGLGDLDGQRSAG